MPQPGGQKGAGDGGEEFLQGETGPGQVDEPLHDSDGTGYGGFCSPYGGICEAVYPGTGGADQRPGRIPAD